MNFFWSFKVCKQLPFLTISLLTRGTPGSSLVIYKGLNPVMVNPKNTSLITSLLYEV